MHILVINSGSSSIKYHLYEMEMEQEQLLLSGKVERIGELDSIFVYREYKPNGKVEEKKEKINVANHVAGLNKIFALLKSNAMMDSIQAIGHRIVHGGENFQYPTIINQDVIDKIREMISLAPLHNPANLAGIEKAFQYYPQLPQVAVFDTAFFRTLPEYAYRYALPNDLYLRHQVRRYGFHGTSHQNVARQTADYLQQPLETLRLITLHLGNGASAAAIHDGICIDTSMGMTPMEGLIMGTRCGDIDPAIHFYLNKELGMNFDEIETVLNYHSGIKGICGVSDMREVHQLVATGDKRASLAIDMYCYRICKYIGAYYTALGGLDALVFTAGIGENDPVIRQLICNQLSVLGIAINPTLNQTATNPPFDISKENTKVKVLVIQTNEELEIAHQTVSTITGSKHHERRNEN